MNRQRGQLKWDLLLVGGGIPEEFEKMIREERLFRSVVRCTETEALDTLLGNPLAVFGLSADRPHEEILHFARMADLPWHRGLLVGSADSQLAYKAYQTYAFADYIVLPTDSSRLEQTRKNLVYWYNWYRIEQV